MRLRLVLLALLLSRGAAAAVPDVPLYQEFGAWLVACDNVRTCEARAFDPAGRGELLIIRAAGATRPMVMLLWDGPYASDAVELDGQELPVASPGWRPDHGGDALSTTDPAAADVVLGRAMNGAELRLPRVGARVQDRRPPLEPAVVPLDGMRAALLLIDDVQGRVGTVARLGPLAAAVGPRTAPPAPPTPARPRWVRPAALSASEGQALIRRARADAGVRQARATVKCDVDRGDTAQALDAGHALVLQACAVSAYQEASLAVVLPRGGGAGRLLDASLPVVPPGRYARLGVLSGAGFLRATGELSFLAKGRGLADCGVSGSWVWSGGAFRLAALAYQKACGGVAAGRFPVLVQTRDAPRP